MTTTRQRYEVESCPYCNAPHWLTVEIVTRRAPGAGASHVRRQIVSVCHYTAGDFLLDVDVQVPTGSVLGRVRAVTFASG